MTPHQEAVEKSSRQLSKDLQEIKKIGEIDG